MKTQKIFKKEAKNNMSRNKKTLEGQILQKIARQFQPGRSRHQDKINNNLNGIYSYGDLKAVKQVGLEFGNYLKKQGISSIEQITPKNAMEYINSRGDLSGWTASKDIYAINKAFGFNIQKKDTNTKARRISEITRSRGDTNAKLTPNIIKNNSDQIAIAMGTGIRRQSMTKITKENFSFKGGRVETLKVKEKGGRIRIIPILDNYKDKITEVVKRSNKASNQPLFGSYSKKIDNHSFRREYAKNYYKQCIAKYGKSREKSYRGYDRVAVQMTSYALGHNRLNIVVEHYLT